MKARGYLEAADDAIAEVRERHFEVLRRIERSRARQEMSSVLIAKSQDALARSYECLARRQVASLYGPPEDTDQPARA